MLGSLAAFWVAVPDAHARSKPVRPTAPQPTLELIAGDGDFNFASDRRRTSHILRFVVSIPSGQKVRSQSIDLTDGGHVFPASHVKVGWRLSTDRRVLTVALGLASEGVGPGRYDGQLPLFVGGVLSKQIPITVKLRTRVISESWTFFLAFGAILLGASVGAVAKWLAEKGMKLQTLGRKYEQVMARLRGVPLPARFAQLLVSAQTSLAVQDAEGADADFKEILPYLGEIESLGEWFTPLRLQADEQRRLLDGELKEYSGLLEPLRNEADRKLGVFDHSWPDPTKTAQQRTEVGQYVATVSRLFAAFSAFERRGHEPAAQLDTLTKIAKLIQSGKIADAETLLAEMLETPAEPQSGLLRVLGSRPGVPEPRQAGAEAKRSPGPKWLERLLSLVSIRRWAIQNASFVMGAILALGVALVGMTVLYFPNETFGGSLDWLKLILWGFGIQLSGFSVAQLGGRALGSGPKIG